jgi:hypothetical protein
MHIPFLIGRESVVIPEDSNLKVTSPTHTSFRLKCRIDLRNGNASQRQYEVQDRGCTGSRTGAATI